MAQYEYKYIDGSRHWKGVTPQTVGEFLEELRNKAGGSLSAQEVVEASKDNRAPLHKLFQWDDAKAGEEYRLWQARRLIASVEVAYTIQDDGKTERRSVRAFVNVNEGGGNRSYTSTIDAMSNDDKRAIVLNAAFEDLEVFRKRFQGLKEFSELFDIMDVVKNKLPRVPKKYAKRVKEIAASL